MKQTKIYITECPRDAMQGWPSIIDTNNKIKYLQQLTYCGFNNLDCGSFVSAKAIPQMADTSEVLNNVSFNNNKVLVIVANEKGAANAVENSKTNILGYPFSISPTFQQKNANSTIYESFERLKNINNTAKENNRETLVYISMAFGNPYGDEYNTEMVNYWIQKINALGINKFALADTVGLATAQQVFDVYTNCSKEFNNVELGLHLHATEQNRAEKIDAGLNAGCIYFDSAILGKGGCPMAGNDLVGNIDTVWLVHFLKEKNFILDINVNELAKAQTLAKEIFI